MHESQLHKANSFITLTYNKEALTKTRDEFEDSPSRVRRLATREERKNKGRPQETEQNQRIADSLSKRDAQLFMKRLRKQLTTQNPSTRIKFYLVGEYGDKNKRPHFHAAIFGEDFAADRYPIGKSPSGLPLYSSPTLEKAWGKGYVSIGDLTFESAAYIARYVMKKINGAQAHHHYQRHDPDTGEVYWITPEFALMSRGGRKGKGIAHGWFQKFGTDAYPHDFVVMNGHQHKPPRYYDQLYALLDKEGATLMKLEREFTSRSQAADNTPRRLRVKEKVALARIAQNRRPLE